jgi:hypothetical protein
MMSVAEEAFALACPGQTISVSDHIGTGSTDMGDLSCIMPVIHPYAAGARGTSHGSNYEIVDPEKACVDSAKWQLVMLHILLSNGAERAKQIIAEFKPKFASKEEFLSFVDTMRASGDRIDYTNEEKAIVKL